jgi:hypothetical protein
MGNSPERGHVPNALASSLCGSRPRAAATKFIAPILINLLNCDRSRCAGLSGLQGGAVTATATTTATTKTRDTHKYRNAGGGLPSPSTRIIGTGRGTRGRRNRINHRDSDNNSLAINTSFKCPRGGNDDNPSPITRCKPITVGGTQAWAIIRNHGRIPSTRGAGLRPRAAARAAARAATSLTKILVNIPTLICSVLKGPSGGNQLTTTFARGRPRPCSGATKNIHIGQPNTIGNEGSTTRAATRPRSTARARTTS